ncbi:hypothetical protein O9H85_36605 [Paenibacillus filicis]|uniref:Aminoglycoside phosphotransferase domain-containing protein n=1 Tax=Paenibacillus gyeongsangnamensis TaxID=3388067 RepID=A0ABT4QLJ7_9BACL|nr:phosphotransferase [Paenibacillus filicis]MCZ8517736.1 hypothetical protein [Paenibacillus filicis]
MMQIIEVREYITPLRKATAVSKIHKGFSYDGKYLVYEGGDKPAYVLRTATFKQTERKRREFEAVGRIHGLGVRTSEPVAFGTVEALGICYMVLRYVDGRTLPKGYRSCWLMNSTAWALKPGGNCL